MSLDPQDPAIVVRPATEDDAGLVVDLIHGAFATRPVLDPPATAMQETVESVAEALRLHGGLVAHFGGSPVGSLLFRPEGDRLWLRRVGVLREVREHGVAHHLSAAAFEHASARGFRSVVLEARAELPATVRFWQHQGFVEVGHDGPRLEMVRALPVSFRLANPEATQEFGRRLAAVVRPGDLVILSGDLGAGKTTLTQGIGEGLRVRGPITSPTFVIARAHPSLNGGPSLVHVDAYRLPGSAELDDLDLDTDLDEAVTVVEWGEGLAEGLAEDRLEIRLLAESDEARAVTVTPIGRRWTGTALAQIGDLL